MVCVLCCVITNGVKRKKEKDPISLMFAELLLLLPWLGLPLHHTSDKKQIVLDWASLLL
jgi:hypothetical protein